MKTISAALAALALLCSAAQAEDTVRLAVGQRGNWDTSVSEVGQRAGIFKNHGLVLDIVYTQGAGETQQAVISGSVDIGIAAGVMGVLSAFSKGAPVRIISAETTGAGDLYWYVKADSPIKDKKDLAGKSVAYSTAGSSTYAALQGFQRVFGVAFKPVATGGPAATLTQAMSGQIDVGWTSPPFALDLMKDGKIRQLMRASDVPELRNQTSRFMTANAASLEARRPVFVRYMQAYREVAEWMYSGPAAIKAFAAWAKVPEAIARLAPEDY